MGNTHLLAFYKRNEPTIYGISSRCAENMEGPFLIAPNEKYWCSPIKVVFVGQETRGWSSKKDISSQIATYSDFNLGEAYYSSPFWNVIRKLETALTGSTFASAWLNINRYDQDGGKPSWKNQKILSELDFLLFEEIKLLKPDIIIFFTGPHYDDRIATMMGATYEPVNNFPLRQLCEIRTPKFEATTFRTYHPNYLRRSGLEKNIIEKIRGEILSRMQANKKQA